MMGKESDLHGGLSGTKGQESWAEWEGPGQETGGGGL